MAKTVEQLGPGGQRLAERELGWHRDLIRKGQREVNSGIICVDAFKSRGRKPTESHLPMLLEDIRAIVDSQIKPTLNSEPIAHSLECGPTQS